jgi:hypothetical protein
MRNLLAAAFLSAATGASALAQSQETWTKVSESAIPASGTRYIHPLNYLTFHLNTAEMKQTLGAAKRQTDPAYVPVYITLPFSDGTTKEYLVYENETMSEELAAEFPDIRSYDAVPLDHSGDVVKLDFTVQGFHAMIMRPGRPAVFIDPFAHLGDQHYYIVYGRDQFATDKSFNCRTETPITELTEAEMMVKSYGDCTKRTYRLALSATGEYTAFHGGTLAQAQSAQITTMNRVNGVYMRDMAITMTIIGGNSALIFTNANTDPFSNGDPDSMIDENQAFVNSTIGSGGYDIGHVFGTDSGGLAGLAVVCLNSQKASGVTGSSAPIGDAFDIDYVAHEMGHQFAGNHTFRNCGGNENPSTAHEPGSGSTIMAYAGICGSSLNVQNNSDDYFHGVSLQEIGNFITSSGHTCPVETAIPSQTAPVISSTNGNVTIPASTPFALTAVASDADGDVLTYCWEQMNSQNSTQPPVATATAGPNFRSFDPTTNPTRYFPRISALLNNGPFTWERLPSVNRTMNFRVVVRDNEANGGCNDAANVTVATVSSAGPFIVNYPTAAGVSWPALSSQTVTWSVANTDAAPVSCGLVDILVSTDGGATFSVVLSDTPNDGTQAITVPNTITTDAIVMVQCANGTFFDISNNEFAITSPSGPCTQPDIPAIAGATTFCAGSSTTLSIASGNLNDATQWSWYLGGCDATAAGTGTSITASSPGTYYVRGTGGCVSGGSCQSVAVSQTTLNTGITQNSGALTSSQAGGSYQWLDCSNGNSAIAGAASQTYTPLASSGSYAVQVTANGCTATSPCFNFSVLGIDEFSASDLSVYPNPTAGSVLVSFSKAFRITEMSVTDVTGRQVLAKKDFTAESVQIDLKDEGKGVYFLNIVVGGAMQSLKIVKE